MAHGKSTVVKAISGVQTVRFKNELERNITIKLGYANAKVYKCKNPKCPRYPFYCKPCLELTFRPSCSQKCSSVLSYSLLTAYCLAYSSQCLHLCRPRSFKAYGSSKEDEPACDVPGFENDKMELLRHVSFVDCPGLPMKPCGHESRQLQVIQPLSCKY